MVKRRKTPNRIKIGYATFKIIPRSKYWGKRKKAAGQMEATINRISYDTSQNVHELPNTIVHEILHAINYVFSINYKNNREEEKIVNAIANGLCTVFVDNPIFLDWLKYRIDKTKKLDKK